MAGRGSRLRPHTLTTPKPMLTVAGMPIVSRLVSDIVKLIDQPVNNIGFILGDLEERRPALRRRAPPRWRGLALRRFRGPSSRRSSSP